MNATATLLASLMMVVGQAGSEGPAERLGNFVLTPIYDVRVPAREPGALVALDVRKGQVVEKGQVLGRVDDSDAMVRKVIAQNELKVAETEAASDADYQAALKTIGVAEAEWEASKAIQAAVNNAVSINELRRNKLTFERSGYQAETAKVKYDISQLTQSMRLAQLQAVDNEIKRRQIEAPIAGVIMERYHNVGEWAQAGEPIYRLVHMDRLRVEGMLNVADLTPEEIEASPEITIYVKVPATQQNPRGEVVLTAQIDFVSRVVDHSGEFLISAEFDNKRKVVGQSVIWLVRPGLDATASLNPALMTLMHKRRNQSDTAPERSLLDVERIRAAREGN